MPANILCIYIYIYADIYYICIYVIYYISQKIKIGKKIFL